MLEKKENFKFCIFIPGFIWHLMKGFKSNALIIVKYSCNITYGVKWAFYRMNFILAESNTLFNFPKYVVKNILFAGCQLKENIFNLID